VFTIFVYYDQRLSTNPAKYFGAIAVKHISGSFAMLALRRLRVSRLTGLRRNAVLAGQDTVDASAPPLETPKLSYVHAGPSTPEIQTGGMEHDDNKVLPHRARRRPTFFHRGRPNISLQNPRKWNRPIAPGVLPAYDEALKVIEEDSANLRIEADGLRVAIAKAKAAEATDGETVERLTQKLKIVEVQSEINLPSVRWSVANGMGKQYVSFLIFCMDTENLFSGNVKPRPSTSCRAEMAKRGSARLTGPQYRYWYSTAIDFSSRWSVSIK